MRPLNNKGMALITALMMTMIILVIIMGMMYMVNQSSKAGYSQKVYRNVTEATYGGADIAMQDVIPRLFQNISTATIAADYSSLTGGMQFSASACLRQKMKGPVSTWTACPAVNLNPKLSPDVSFKLAGLQVNNTTAYYNVYAKIVDTVKGVQFAPGATSGNQLIGSSVAESSGGTTLSLQHYVYTIEVAGDQTNNPAGKAAVSVLYEY